MPGVQDVEHVKVGVSNLDRAVEFHTDVAGLDVVERDGRAVYLGCGYDDNYDLALVEGEPELDHVAVKVEDEAAIDAFEGRLADNDVATERVDGDEPGQERGVRFELPGGATMELVVPSDRRYRSKTAAALADRPAIAPLDLDHLALQSDDVKADAEFLCDLVGFKLSDVVGPEPGPWEAAWTRYDRQHHGIFFSDNHGSGATFHHLAWTMASFDHMKQFVDHLVQSGHALEMGLGRHRVGDNIFAYFLGPAGIRTEITIELEMLHPDASPNFYDSVEEAIFLWEGTVVPEDFMAGYDIG